MSVVAPALRLGPATLGACVGPREQEIDARWLMAYAASLGETNPRCFDTGAPEGPVAHPLFSVCYEWPAMLALRERAIPEEIAIRGVHATHDVTLHRPPRARDRLHTTTTVTGLARRRAGALMTVRQETVDAGGLPVSTTHYGSVYRDVGFEGEDAGPRSGARGDFEMPAGAIELPVAVPAGLAHVYTECARIWNPIHTDVAVARAAGLPDIILHGTASLALAVSRVLAHAGADPRAVSRVSARFAGMVRVPSGLTLRLGETANGTTFRFEATGDDGALVLTGGTLQLA